MTSLFQPGQTFDVEEQAFGRSALSYETAASVSGGTEQTRYFISGLAKNDEGIGINTGYKKHSLRANIDQQLASWINLSVNTNVIHSQSDRGLSNNDNTGTSPVRSSVGHTKLSSTCRNDPTAAFLSILSGTVIRFKRSPFSPTRRTPGARWEP